MVNVNANQKTSHPIMYYVSINIIPRICILGAPYLIHLTKFDLLLLPWHITPARDEIVCLKNEGTSESTWGTHTFKSRIQKSKSWLASNQHQKSVNLQYNTVCWINGTNHSSTKGLMFQILFYFMKSCKILLKNTFNFFS